MYGPRRSQKCTASKLVSPWRAVPIKRKRGRETVRHRVGDSLNRRSKKPLEFRHALRLKAAEFWLALGEVQEAKRELNKIPPNHPSVAEARKKIDAHLQFVRTLIQDDGVVVHNLDSE